MPVAPHGHRRLWPLSLAALGIVLSALAAASAQEARTREPDAAAPTARYLPPAGAAPRPQLGIQARNTLAGVEIASVLPGSLAQRAGLEAGDTIVTVGGFQVGFVGERLYDVGDEIARRMNGNGDVNLLVRNGRDGRLVNVPVRLATGAPPAISGRIIPQDPVTLPASAVATVRVLDVTDPQWRDVAVVQGRPGISGGLPTGYRVEVPPLVPQHRYAIDARVEDQGRVILQSPSATSLPAVDRDLALDLMVSGRGLSGPTTGPAPRDQIEQWIRAYLGRPPRPLEVDMWLADMQRGRSLAGVQAGILSSTELFERQRRSRDLYVTEVFRLLYGMPPNAAQFADLQARYDRALGVRLRFVEDLQRQPR